VYHLKITGIQIGSDEPLWVVNFKKGIASQLQMDITGVRSVGPAVNWQSAPKDGESIVFTTFEVYSFHDLINLLINFFQP
jgi:hypothetical protein